MNPCWHDPWRVSPLSDRLIIRTRITWRQLGLVGIVNLSYPHNSKFTNLTNFILSARGVLMWSCEHHAVILLYQYVSQSFYLLLQRKNSYLTRKISWRKTTVSRDSQSELILQYKNQLIRHPMSSLVDIPFSIIGCMCWLLTPIWSELLWLVDNIIMHASNPCFQLW